MISLVRKSSKHLVIETNDMNAIENYFINNLKAFKSSLYTISSKTNEDYTIVYITNDLSKPAILHKDTQVYMLPLDSDEILCRITNDKKHHLVKSLRIAPRQIIMRYFGNLDKIIYSILKDYEGKTANLKDSALNFELTDSIIVFTEKPLSRNLSLDDMNEKCVLVKKPFKELYRNIKLNLLRYLNEGLENKNWYELDIRIYDIYNAYHLHYRRLRHVLDNLELGLVLGENWSRDRAVMLMTVGVYSIKLFTLHEPKYIKKILMGLEFSSDNERLCDYDLYYKKKKISWIDIAKNKKESRLDVAARCRKELIDMLPPSSVEYINDLEKEIIKNTQN
mgnify:CR=1 FL=1